MCETEAAVPGGVAGGATPLGTNWMFAEPGYLLSAAAALSMPQPITPPSRMLPKVPAP
jgi:hypothetical protein